MRAMDRFVDREVRPDAETVVDAARARAAEAAVDTLAPMIDLADPQIRMALAKVIGSNAEQRFVRELIRRLR